MDRLLRQCQRLLGWREGTTCRHVGHSSHGWHRTMVGVPNPGPKALSLGLVAVLIVQIFALHPHSCCFALTYKAVANCPPSTSSSPSMSPCRGPVVGMEWKVSALSVAVRGGRLSSTIAILLLDIQFLFLLLERLRLWWWCGGVGGPYYLLHKKYQMIILWRGNSKLHH